MNPWYKYARSVLFLASMLYFVACQTTPPQRLDEQMSPPLFDSENPRQDLVGIQIALEQYAEAIAALIAQGINPEDIRDPDERALLAAQASFLTGDIPGAIVLLDSIEDKVGREREIVYLRALIASYGREWERAEQYFLELLALDENDPKILSTLGEVYVEMEDYTKAQMLYQTSLRIDRNPRTLQGYAELFRRQKQYVRAEDIYTDALKLDDSDHLLYANRGQVRALQDAFVPALVDYTRAIELQPEYPWHYFDRGKVRAELRRTDKALADFNHFITVRPDIFITYFYRAQLHEIQHDYTAAMHDYERVLELQSDFYPAYSGYAVALFAKGLYKRSLKYLTTVYEQDPYTEYAMLIGLALYATQDFDVLNTFLVPVIKSTAQRDVFYFLLRALMNPKLLSRAEQAVAKEKNAVDRTKGYYYIGAFHEIMENKRIAKKFYEMVKAEQRKGLFETELALYKIEQDKP